MMGGVNLNTFVFSMVLGSKGISLSVWAIYSDLSRRLVTPEGSDCKVILPKIQSYQTSGGVYDWMSKESDVIVQN